jgi:hypothetical protein
MAEYEAQRYERLKESISDYMEVGGGADVLVDDLRAIVQELRNYPDKLAMWFDQLEDLLK